MPHPQTHHAGTSHRPGISRRRLLGAAAAGLATSALPGFNPGMARAAQGGARPNFLVLLADDQTFNTIHMLGNAQVRTPNLDRLAGRGTTMSHCFNQGGWHGAICVASRAMMNSGRHLFRVVEPHDNKRAGNLQADDPLWAEHFRANGYDTFATGKWHNGGQGFTRSFSHGDAVLLEGMHPYGGDNGNNGGPIVTGHAHPTLNHYDSATDRFEPYTTDKWSTDCFADAAVRFIDSRKGQQGPFFAYVAFTAPHDPRHAPQRYLDLYHPDRIELPPNFLPEHPFNFGVRGIRDEVLLPYPRDEEAVRREIATYYAMVTHIDERIGDILDALERAGRADNTYIVFTSDHGLALGRHGLLGKQNQYDHSVRVPMVWSGPGINPGEISDELVYLHAMYATTCELAGLEAPGHVDEPSLVPVFSSSGRGHDAIYGGYTDTIRMLRTDRYKLIRYPKVNQTQLFDLEQDPWEMVDLAERPGERGRVRGLDARLRRWQDVVGDPLKLEPLS